MPRRSFSSLAALAVAVCVLLPALAKTPEVTLLYDTEFGGYVPVVGGIERPDLVIRQGDGRAPESARTALRRAKSGVRRGEYPELPSALLKPDELAAARKLSRRWLRKTAITSEFLVLDGFGRPVEGARVYRYTDPSFYPVNQDSSGARLFDTWRLLPVPLPAMNAASLAAAFDAFWAGEGSAFATDQAPNIDLEHNPWTRAAITGMPPLELVGRTDMHGTLRAVSGTFNLKDPRRFPRAIVPDAIRIGFVIVADGFQPATSERRYTSGGLFENRTIQLLDAPDRPLFDSNDWRAALPVVDGWAVAARPLADFERDMEHVVESLAGNIDTLDAGLRDGVRNEATARLWERLLPRLGRELQLELAHTVVALAPTPARHFRLARMLVEGGKLPLLPPKKAGAPDARLAEAEETLSGLIRLEPRFQPAYRLLDRLLVRRGAATDERRGWFNRLLREYPFDAWGRARMATLLLAAGHDAEAFDHLRYTYMAQPGIGGDRELALALSAYYWRIGLPEKAGAYAWLLTGRVPEDPTVRPRFR